MNAELAATVALGLVATVSGWFVWQNRPARLSAAALGLGGVAVLLGSSGVLLDEDDVAAPLYRLAGCLLLPIAINAYPRLRWRDPLAFVLAVLVVAGGSLCVVWPESFDVIGFIVISALLVDTWWSFERGEPDERRTLAWASLAWIGAGLTAVFLTFLSAAVDGTSTGRLDPVLIGLTALGPIAMAVGAVRPEVVDVRALVTRAVVTGTVLTCYVAAAVGLAAAIDVVVGQPLGTTPLVVLCGVLAFGVRPLQVLLRGVVDQLLFGDRPDPLAAATTLADRIGDDPALALDAIREALVLPYASLRGGGEVLASSGSEVTHTRVLPLRLGEDEVGEVVVGLRAGDLALSATDADVLRIVAPLLAQTLRARAMSRDLQRSREAVVTAVEEERRRLRRDLHDGLGPTLSGVAFATDAARNQLHTDPEKADELLVRLRADTAGAIAEIRRLVEGLRPPALDELGLIGAIMQHAATLHSASGAPLRVAVEVSVSLPPLSAATEVAAYRLVVEALTNVARHAEATSAVVELEVCEEDMVLSVRDDGRSTRPWTPGVGINSMHERSQQVGGTMRATATPDGGIVEARLPLARPARGASAT